MQFFYWLIGIFVGVLTIIGATARVVAALGQMNTNIALVQLKMDQLETMLEKLEKRFEAAPRSQ
jgi:hypothetical protein